MICREYKKINELFNQVNDVAVEMCRGKMCRGGLAQAGWALGLQQGREGKCWRHRMRFFWALMFLFLLLLV